uniref:DUF927 domain-containing protein n=1 Tax=Macrostomum lignano TaxID=282301 RepID=A0A1I8FG14_9PLAT
MAGDDDEELNSAAEVYSCFRHIELLPGQASSWQRRHEGRLSSLQLQGVLYACQRHQTLLPGGERAGLFIGDGRGRESARAARSQGDHSWTAWPGAAAPPVAECVARPRPGRQADLLAIGCHAHVIDGCRQLDRSATARSAWPRTAARGVLFNTYTPVWVSGGSGASRKTRLEQLIDLLAPATPRQPNSTAASCWTSATAPSTSLPDAKEAANSKVAAAVIELPAAGCRWHEWVYCSATGVSELKNLAYMTRLGLWGPSRPFASFQDFRACWSAAAWLQRRCWPPS